MHKPLPLAAAAVLATLAGTAQAQSSVTIYGILDAGVNYVDNVAGKSYKSVDSGQSVATRLGFRGVEDLGGGLSALFTLEHQVRVDQGTAQNATAFWNRGAFVGLSSREWGTLTVGRQIDFMNTDLPPDSAPLLTGGQAAGWQSASGLQLDVHYGTNTYDNSVKWKHEAGPVKFGLMVGRGNEGPGEKMYGGFATYYAGAFSIGVGAMRDNYVNANFARQTAGVKMLYRPKGWGVFANLAQASDPRNQSEIVPVEVGLLYDIAPKVLVGGGLGFAKVTNRTGQTARLTQPFLGAKYLLSPRSNLYIMAARNSTSNRAVVPATVSGPGGAPGVSSDSAQTGIRAGIRIGF